MLDGLRQLMDLQALDDQRAAAREQQEGLPGRRSGLAAARAEAEARVEHASETLQAAELEQRSAETELQDQEALLRKLEGQQTQVKTNEAYTALLSEIDAAREAISVCETRILEAMETIETGRSASHEAEAVREREDKRVGAEERTLDERSVALDAQLKELDAQRAKLVAEIDTDLYGQYERVAKRLGTAVANVSDETCQGCRVNIPPQLQIELLRGERLIACQRCKRILILAK